MTRLKKPWKQITIGDFISIQRGHDLTNDERLDGTIPVYGAAGHNGYHSIAKSSGPGIVIGRSGGSFGQVHFVNEDYWPHNTSLYVKDFKGNDPHFVYNLLKLLDFSSLNSGSAQPSLNRNFLYPVKICIPEPILQKQIAKVLSNLDAKIDVNNKINQELEAMAKTLYDYWFVQFDFPDVNGKPYKSSGGKMVFNEGLKREIPEGWEVEELEKMIKIERGISYKSADIKGAGIPMINLNSFNLDGTYKKAGIKMFSGRYSEKKMAISGDLLIAVTDVTRNAEIIGKSILVPEYYDKLVYSMDIAKIIPNDKLSKAYLMMLFNSDHYHNYIKWFASGTIVLHLNMDGMNWYDTEIPPKQLIEKYDSFYKPIAKRISDSTKQNQKLSELRDWLLPMLMNGQVTVGEAEEELGMVVKEKQTNLI